MAGNANCAKTGISREVGDEFQGPRADKPEQSVLCFSSRQSEVSQVRKYKAHKGE